MKQRYLSLMTTMALLLGGAGSFADEQPANLTQEDQNKPEESDVLPVSLFKGRVTNQASRYVLGPGDVLSLKIQDLEKFNQKISIRPDGYATIHPFGEFYLSGTDVQGLESWLREKFKFYLVKPDLTVNVDEMRPAIVYVTGAVQKPGTYQFLRQGLSNSNGTNSLNEKVQLTLTNVLAKAGGVGLYADIDNIEVVHAVTGQRETFNLREFLTSNGTMQDIWLLPEDTVNVPEANQPMDPLTFKLICNSTYFREKFPVVVLGAVQKQGEVQMDPTNNTLNAAIGLAGGFISGLSKRDFIIVQRPGKQGNFSRWVINRNKSNLELLPGDIVYVSDSKVASLERGLKFLNSITQPYYFSVQGSNVIKNGLFSGD
jgi:polysaccharide export outer membrane protein